MEVSYRRDFNHNYMILEKEEVSGEEYMIRMIEQNHIPELLKFRVRKMNGKTYLYYEITSRQPVSQVYESRSMKHGDIERLLMGIRDGMNRARQYLLNNEDILLDPEFIYMDIDTRQIQLCYIPYSGQENRHSFLRLAEFVLKSLDHGERQAVDLGYELFHQASKENFGFSEIVQLLLRENTGRTVTDQAAEHFREADPVPGRKIEERSLAKPTEAAEKPDRPKEKEDQIKSGAAGRISKEKAASGKKGWLIGSLAAAGMLIIFGAIVYFAGLDLTQTGGLAFLLLAIVWIISGAAGGKRNRKKKEWIEDDFQEEEQFLETVFSETDDAMEEENPYGFGQRGSSEAGGAAQDEGGGGIEGETRCLTEAEKGRSFRLASLEADKYGDIILDKEKMLVGKKKDQVDIWLGDASVSRIHARLERNREECFVTDLNSMNGTYVEGERLLPNEKRRLCEGDKISFAVRHYRVKVREF
ncbi:MAG: DUF6382 domain-containing protein [Lachnospiraceae bacterium]|nr:DUF6382 domain-containing protein [Lachnospiraceae bacterium]